MSRLPRTAPGTPALRPRLLTAQSELVDVRTLHEHPENANEANDGGIYESIGVTGFYGGLVVQRSTRRVLVGHGRRRAALGADLHELPVFWADVDDETALRILGGDNWTREGASSNRLAELALLDKLARTEAGLAGTGRDLEDLEALTRELGDAHLEAAGADGDLDEDGEGAGDATDAPEPDGKVPLAIRKLAAAIAEQLVACPDVTASGRLVVVLSSGDQRDVHSHECGGLLRRRGYALAGATGSGATMVELYGVADPCGAADA